MIRIVTNAKFYSAPRNTPGIERTSILFRQRSPIHIIPSAQSLVC